MKLLIICGAVAIGVGLRAGHRCVQRTTEKYNLIKAKQGKTMEDQEIRWRLAMALRCAGVCSGHGHEESMRMERLVSSLMDVVRDAAQGEDENTTRADGVGCRCEQCATLDKKRKELGDMTPKQMERAARYYTEEINGKQTSNDS